MGIPTAATGVRRLAAFGLDYLVLAAYIALLTAASIAARGTLQREVRPPASPRERLAGQALGFATLTLPTALYFALAEASPQQATLGKRALRLRVIDDQGGRVPVRRAVLRAAVKFAPWELAHTALWQTPGIFTAAAAPTALQWCAYGCSLLLAGGYLGSLFAGGRRTPYDRLAGTRVIVTRAAV